MTCAAHLMANKVKVQMTLSVTATGSTASISGTEAKDQVGTNYQESTQLIGTTAEQLDFGADIGTLGWLFVKNLAPVVKPRRIPHKRHVGYFLTVPRPKRPNREARLGTRHGQC